MLVSEFRKYLTVRHSERNDFFVIVKARNLIVISLAFVLFLGANYYSEKSNMIINENEEYLPSMVEHDGSSTFKSVSIYRDDSPLSLIELDSIGIYEQATETNDDEKHMLLVVSNKNETQHQDRTHATGYRVIDCIFSNTKLHYPEISSENNVSICLKVNEEIIAFLNTYYYSFVEGTCFDIEYQIVRNDSNVLSILFLGQVLTPSKGMRQAFALNFNLNQGELLTIRDVVNEECIIEALANGSLDVLVERDAAEFEVPSSIAYQEFRVISGDDYHSFDFFLDNERFFVIISQSSSSGYYAIYYTELGTSMMWSNVIDPVSKK